MINTHKLPPPAGYHYSPDGPQVIKYAQQLAENYGSEQANEICEKYILKNYQDETRGWFWICVKVAVNEL